MRCIKIIWHHIFFILTQKRPHTEYESQNERMPAACSWWLLCTIANGCVIKLQNLLTLYVFSFRATHTRPLHLIAAAFMKLDSCWDPKGAEEYSFEIKNQPTAKKNTIFEQQKKTVWRNMHLNSVPIHNRIEHLFHDSWISFEVLSFFSINTCPFEKYSSRRNAQQKQIHEFVLLFFRRFHYAKKTYLHELTLGFDRFVNSFASSLWTIHLIFILMTVEQKKENRILNENRLQEVRCGTGWMTGWLTGAQEWLGNITRGKKW